MRKEAKTNELSERLVTVVEPACAASEAYRSLRTNLLYSSVDSPPKVIVFTSPGPKEGKSTTCANLGVVLAQAEKSTLIVDCDFRKPAIHKFFGLRNVYGVVNILTGEYKLQEVWEEPLPGLKVVTAGPILPSPVELLTSPHLSELLASAREEFDCILVDAPPIGLVSDPTILATQGDGVLLLVDAQNTRKVTVRQAMRSLEVAGVNVLGTVVSNVNVGSPSKQKTTTSQQNTHEKRRATKKNKWLVEFLIMLLVSFALLFGVVKPFIVEAFYVPSESMVPTLQVGDRVLANKFIYRLSEPKREDIIVFESVEYGVDLMKRVVGVPGDEIEVRSGILFVNGEQQEVPYLNRELPDDSSYGTKTVPPGHVFVMGDNRADSADSRIFGAVPKENIVGEAFLRVWPLKQLALL